jgi:hypothetical protein
MQPSGGMKSRMPPWAEVAPREFTLLGRCPSLRAGGRRVKRGWMKILNPCVWMLASTALLADSGGFETERYSGKVSGAVTVSFTSTGEAIASDVVENSNIMGRARQVFTSVDVSNLPYSTSGAISSIGEDGRELFLSFQLQAVRQLSANSIAFVGQFEVSGGAGEFEFPLNPPPGGFGDGAITGSATVDSTQPGVIRLQFQDHFSGVLRFPESD